MTWFLDYLNYHQWGITDNHAEAHYLGDRLAVEEQALELTDDEVADFRRVEAEYDAWQERLDELEDRLRAVNHARIPCNALSAPTVRCCAVHGNCRCWQNMPGRAPAGWLDELRAGRQRWSAAPDCPVHGPDAIPHDAAEPQGVA